MSHCNESKATLLNLLTKQQRTRSKNFSSIRSLGKMWPSDTGMVLKEKATGTVGFLSTLIVKVFPKA